MASRMYVAFPTLCQQPASKRRLMEIRPDPTYIPDIYGKMAPPDREKTRLTLLGFLRILRPVTLIWL